MEHLYEVLRSIEGFIYPNEIELRWSILIVLYPYVTGLVAGAFILASLEKVFEIRDVRPTYRLSLLTALAFLICAPLPLVFHITHPFRGFEIFLTPHLSSAMAVFGFVYIWYLMAILLIEIWLEYRKEIIEFSKINKGIKGFIYKILTLGVKEINEEIEDFDKRFGKFIAIIGIPSAILLHGYVGFIFGSVKANPWWSSVIMPVIFLFSAMVSGIALVIFIYMVLNYLKGKEPSIPCLDAMAKYLLYSIIIDFSLEMLDLVQRIYEAEEFFDMFQILIKGKLFISLFIFQILIGAILPILFLGYIRIFGSSDSAKKFTYFLVSVMVLIGIFATRWNVVIGGQLFSKSLRGLTIYKLGLIGREGIYASMGLLFLPFLILLFLIWLLPPYEKERRV
uniref:Polysulfide reductase n=1 Tax=candidate division WOR-3 bacterium TaxID=2052148 RepID=A0A7V4E1R2_UNCW3